MLTGAHDKLVEKHVYNTAYAIKSSCISKVLHKLFVEA